MNDYEYSETPGNDVTRATTNCLYLIDCRKEEVIEKLHEEFKELILAGLYLLLDNTANKIYIGESSNISERLKQHIKKSIFLILNLIEYCLFGMEGQYQHHILVMKH